MGDEKLVLVRRQLLRLRARIEQALSNIDRDTERGNVAWRAVEEAKIILQGLSVVVGPLREEDLAARAEEMEKGKP